MRPRFFVDLTWIVTVATACFLAAQLGLKVAYVAKQVSAVWPPAGVALAALLLLGYRVWPGVAIGAFLASVTAGESLGTALGIACGSTLEALAGSWLLARFTGFDNALQRFKDALGLVIVAAGLSTMLSATIGVASLCLGGFQPWANFGRLWGVWWLGDAMGDLVVAPALLVWVTSWRRTWSGWSIAEAVTLVTVVLAVSLVTFSNAVPDVQTHHAYALFPLVIWSALRFGPVGTTTATLLISVIAIVGTLHGHGPFNEGSVTASLTVLQLFMAVAATTGLLLAAATSERKQTEWALKECDKRKDEFLATLAHELRNPLAPISNAMQFFQLTETPDPNARAMTDIIERQVCQMTRLVDDLLDISRITRDKLELRKEVVDLAGVVQSAVETARLLIEAQSHELTVTLPPAPILLQADHVRLAQVFSNLLHNAAKFTPREGRIELCARRDGGDIVVTVRDNGVGIPAVELSRVFEMFMQVRQSSPGTPSGLGIGLALAKRLVALHGGTIEAASQGRGQGSEFRVRLPAIVPAPIQRAQLSAGDRKCACRMPYRILVVDDNQDSVESLSLLLSALGSEVHKAYDGSEAVERAQNLRPEVVLLDIGMPVLNGYETARHIRSREWGTDMVLIALTGWGQEEDRRRSAEAGFDHHLTKPVDISALRSLLNSLSVGTSNRT